MSGGTAVTFQGEKQGILPGQALIAKVTSARRIENLWRFNLNRGLKVVVGLIIAILEL